MSCDCDAKLAESAKEIEKETKNTWIKMLSALGILLLVLAYDLSSRWFYIQTWNRAEITKIWQI